MCSCLALNSVVVWLIKLHVFLSVCLSSDETWYVSFETNWLRTINALWLLCNIYVNFVKETELIYNHTVLQGSRTSKSSRRTTHSTCQCIIVSGWQSHAEDQRAVLALHVIRSAASSRSRVDTVRLAQVQGCTRSMVGRAHILSPVILCNDESRLNRESFDWFIVRN